MTEKELNSAIRNFKVAKSIGDMRWVNVNRIDPEVQKMLQRGTRQHILPTKETPTRVVGSTAAAVKTRKTKP